MKTWLRLILTAAALLLLGSPAAAKTAVCKSVQALMATSVQDFAENRGIGHTVGYQVPARLDPAAGCTLSVHRSPAGSAELRCTWQAASREAMLDRYRALVLDLRDCLPNARVSRSANNLTRFFTAEGEVDVFRSTRSSPDTNVSVAVRPPARSGPLGMWIYLALLAPALIVAGATRWGHGAQRHALAAAAVGLTLFIGLRRQVGSDWDNYQRVFSDVQQDDLGRLLISGDPAYGLLNALAGELGAGVWLVNLVCAALLVAGVIRLAAIQTRPALALLLATPVLLMITGMSFTRQAAAAGLFLLAIERFEARRRLQPSLLLLLAVGFHWTAIVLLPLIGLMSLRRLPHWRLLPALGVAAGIAGLALSNLPAVASALGGVGVAKGAVLRASLTFGAGMLFLVRGQRLGWDERTLQITAFLAAVGLCSFVLALGLPTVGDRLAIYAIPLQMIVLSRAPDLFAGTLRRRLAEASIAAAPIFLLTGWLAATSYKPCLAPYRTYLADPAAMAAGVQEYRRSALCQAIQDVEGNRGVDL